MKLFLASQDMGDFPEVLEKFVGEKKRALIISDARDYYQDEERIEEALEKTFVNLQKIGIENKRLDLREYFGKSDKLAEDVQMYDPGLIFAIGGNIYCLATALHESGMDEIIRQGVEDDKFVYGGYSAGAAVAADDLSLYEVMGDNPALHRSPEIVHEVYGIEPYKEGLKLIEQYIVPHIDRVEVAKENEERLENIAQVGAEAVPLEDAEVFLVKDEKEVVLRREE